MIARMTRKLKRLAPQLAALVLILAANTIIAPGFLDISFQNGRLYGSLIDILVRAAPVAILSVGMTLVIATRGIDLSVGAVMAISGAFAASLIVAGYPLAIVIPAALGVGLLCGLWNGFLVAVFDLQPIIATLILMVAGRGIAQLVTEGAILTFNSDSFAALGSGSFLGVPVPVLIWILAGLAVGLAVRTSALGFLIEATGINRRAAMLAGVKARFLLFSVYAVSGVGAALAGLIAAADIRGADANNAGLWLELDAILAVVIGGTSLNGGRFSIMASLLGALIIQAINTGILMAGFPPEFNLIIKAIIIVIVLTFQSPAIVQLIAFLRSERKGNRAKPVRQSQQEAQQ
ncbi:MULTISPECIES: ABC transporter permease [Brucella/Ochrobactrum group]|jgi:simple sugar transport system permease protein|uniref:ABC transporter permease n=1 Tax=Brucella pseudintermedia TaxID=370111 RepID=A0ABY5U8B1_9HYPH|nr:MULTISPECIES: ABC transporter permease [Brucella/Ochrobactrum group]KAB2685504.1 ABC transporter permease [Brucella pseudintermedia]NKE76625.1 ABC transporter permease [Ochrobactrum sp. MC-1LL]TWH04083.1 monosaccharide ABC transporter membrane protein (CUT2 family) [Ochrobactrum sp. J50]UWL59116.1 ABC transporter permease [Brucella pseudintermedia]WPM79506.1 ABC transporter permease [Brucella pseudintermedia]